MPPIVSVSAERGLANWPAMRATFTTSPPAVSRIIAAICSIRWKLRRTLSAPNYTFTTGTTATFTITPATLNVNAVANSKVYGASDPTLSASLSGFKFSDNAGNSAITGSASCSRTCSSVIG